MGSYLIQMAKLHQMKVITTCSKKNFDYVEELGADYVIDYKTENVYERINKITGHVGVDYVVNTVNGDSATKDLNIMKFGGELAAVAGLPDLSDWKFYDQRISIHEIAFGNYLTYPDEEIQKVPARTAQALCSLVAEGSIRVPEITKISSAEIPDYLHRMKEKKVRGKVVARLL